MYRLSSSSSAPRNYFQIFRLASQNARYFRDVRAQGFGPIGCLRTANVLRQSFPGLNLNPADREQLVQSLAMNNVFSAGWTIKEVVNPQPLIESVRSMAPVALPDISVALPGVATAPSAIDIPEDPASRKKMVKQAALKGIKRWLGDLGFILKNPNRLQIICDGINLWHAALRYRQETSVFIPYGSALKRFIEIRDDFFIYDHQSQRLTARRPLTEMERTILITDNLEHMDAIHRFYDESQHVTPSNHRSRHRAGVRLMCLHARAKQELMSPEDLAALLILDQLRQTGQLWRPHSMLRRWIGQPILNTLINPVLKALGRRPMHPDRAVVFKYNEDKHAFELIMSEVLSTAVGWEELVTRYDMVGGKYWLDADERALKDTLDDLKKRVFMNTLEKAEDDPRKVLEFSRINKEREKILAKLETSWRNLPYSLWKRTDLPLTGFERKYGARLMRTVSEALPVEEAMFLAINHNWRMRKSIHHGHLCYELYREIHAKDGTYEVPIASISEMELTLAVKKACAATPLSQETIGDILRQPAMVQLLALSILGERKKIAAHPRADEILLPGLSIIAKMFLNPPDDPLVINPYNPLASGMDGLPIQWHSVVRDSIALTATSNVGFDVVRDINNAPIDVVGFDQRFQATDTVLEDSMRQLRVYLEAAKDPQIARDRLEKIHELERALRMVKYLRELSAIYGHDLRTPLTVIVGYLSVMKMHMEKAFSGNPVAQVAIREGVAAMGVVAQNQRVDLDRFVMATQVGPEQAYMTKPIRLMAHHFSGLLEKYGEFQSIPHHDIPSLIWETGNARCKAVVIVPPDLPLVQTNISMLLTFIFPLIQNAQEAMAPGYRNQRKLDDGKSAVENGNITHHLYISAQPTPDGKWVQLEITNTGSHLPDSIITELNNPLGNDIGASFDSKKKSTGVSLKIIPMALKDLGCTFSIGNTTNGERAVQVRILIPVCEDQNYDAVDIYEP